MNEKVLVACDPGNDSMKQIINGHYYKVSTILKKAYEARRIVGNKDKGDHIEFLDVNIKTNGIEGNYYVGELAKSGDNQESLGGFKSENENILIVMLTSIAYGLYKEYPGKTKFSIKLGTCLPVNEYFDKNIDGEYDFRRLQAFSKRLAGTHKIKFNSKLFDGAELTLSIDADDITLLPEGYAALLSVLYNEDGSSKYPQYTDRKNINIFGLDLGGGSTDSSAICNGTYLSEAFFAIDKGLSEAQDRLCEDIARKARFKSFSRYELNTYLQDPELEGMIVTNLGEIDIHEEKKAHYDRLADDILYHYRKKLNSNGLTESMVNVLFLVGGGAIEMGDNIINKFQPIFHNVIKVEDDPVNANVKALYAAIQE